MKNVISVFLILFALQILAQSPQAINYQTVVRNSVGETIPNQQMNFRISILENNANGTVVYQETQKLGTNDFGLVSFQIGKGLVVSGAFNTIDWGNHEYFIKTELDITGGTNFVLMGTQQLVSVPYALYAEKSGNSYYAGQGINIANDTISAQTNSAIWNANELQGRSINNQAPQIGQALIWNGQNWIPTTIVIQSIGSNPNTLIYTTDGF